MFKVNKRIILGICVCLLIIGCSGISNKPKTPENSQPNQEVISSKDKTGTEKVTPLTTAEDDQNLSTPEIVLEDPKPASEKINKNPAQDKKLEAPNENLDEIQPTEDPNKIVYGGQGNCKFAQVGIHRHYKYPQSNGPFDWVDNKKLRKDTAQAFLAMRDQASQEGIDLKVISGFRSFSDQEYLFYDIAKQRRQSLSTRAQVSAVPEHSEHSTGLAVDINSLSETFADTPEYAWLEANAWKYGFELSFPRGNHQNIAFEPWHRRYIGVNGENASIFCRDQV